MYDPNAVSNADLVSEGTVNDSLLDELAKEPAAGAWPIGWYRAKFIEGFSTKKGNQQITGNFLSQQGDSWNLRLSLEVTNAKGEIRNIQSQLNYRTEDLTESRLQAIKEARDEFKGVKQWPGTSRDLQRSSLAIANIGQLKKAVGFSVKTMENGLINPEPYIGQAVDVHLGHRTTEGGQVFNEITDFAPAGTKAGKK